ncbi:hypothetical protein ACFSX9_05185 [Flavobacterium ardleyense]|uniref:CAAX protease self-immunity n=1 Tax=Flavobacterium ardleyense TaxID=2038737 RepID=A0ABW5Z5U2_9FLAO
MLDLIKFIFFKKNINEIAVGNKLKLFLILFCINFLIMVLSKIVFVELEDLGLIQKINKEKKILYTGFKLFAITGFLVPIIEEIINRLWLKFNKYYLPISMSLFVFIFYYVFIFNNNIDSLFSTPLDFLKSLFMSIVVFYIIKLFVIKNEKTLIYIYERHILKILMGSALFFSLLHLSTYNFNTANSIYFVPFFLAPYFIAGILLGYVRLTLGFRSALYFHILHNSILVGLKILIS